MNAALVLHVVALALTLPAGIAMSAIIRVRGASPAEVSRRLLLAIVVFAAAACLDFGAFASLCAPGSTPNLQVFLPAASAAICAAVIAPPFARWLCAFAFFMLGLALSAHFHRLVLPSDGWQCRFTGDPAYIHDSCASSKIAEEVWHTPLTGLYGLR